MKKLFLVAMLVVISATALNARGRDVEDKSATIDPTATVKFAIRDTTALFMDYYAPKPGSQTQYHGKTKPTILFVFGGGFKRGTRKAEPLYYKLLSEAGYGVIAIDYRLGMKGVVSGGGLSSFNVLNKAIHMAVEDLFSATEFLIMYGSELGVNPNNIVLCGSSAGAITVLQTVWELDNRSEYAKNIPLGYMYKGVMSFAGGIISNTGKVSFTDKVCPFMMCQGTNDKVVKYNQIKFFNIGFFGLNKIEDRLEKFNVKHNVYRYIGNGHEIAAQMPYTVNLQQQFLERIVMDGENLLIDAKVTDPSIEKWKPKTTADLYKKD